MPMGFYTVRFVDAPSKEEAIARVIEMVHAAVQSMYRDGYPRKIEVEEVREDEDGFAKYAPGVGFSWYPEEQGGDEAEEERDREHERVRLELGAEGEVHRAQQRGEGVFEQGIRPVGEGHAREAAGGGASGARLPVALVRASVFLSDAASVEVVYVAAFRRGRYDLLDEPTSGLDPGAAADFNALIERLRGEGAAVGPRTAARKSRRVQQPPARTR